MAELNMNLAGFSAYSDEFELLPPGEYQVRITAAELRFPKSGGSQYLNLRYDVIDGPKKGRVIFDAINLWSNNSTAREIASRKLKSVGVAIRIPNPDYIGDSDELLQGEMVVRIIVKKDETGQYGDKNEVKGYKPIAGVSVGGAPMAQGAMLSQGVASSVATPSATLHGQAGTPPPPPMARPATPWAQTA